MAYPENTEASRKPLADRVAIVTGGGRGLGRAYAIALAKAGASVAVTARTESEIQVVQREIEQHDGRALAIPADVTDPKAVTQLVAGVEQQLGPVDLLVNNAGVLRAIGRVTELEADDWWREVEINVRGPFLCSQAVLPGMFHAAGNDGTTPTRIAVLFLLPKGAKLTTVKEGTTTGDLPPGPTLVYQAKFTANSLAAP